MYNYKILKNVDDEWKNNLKRSTYATFYQSKEYLKQDNTRFPLFVYVYDKDNSIKGQLGMMIIKTQSVYSTSLLKKYTETISKIGNRGTWVSGPIIHSNDKDERLDILNVIMEAIEEITKKNNLMIVDGYSPPQDFDIDSKYLNEIRKNGFKIENYITFALDLKKDIDEIWKNVKKNSRNDVTRAERRNIITKEIKNKDGLKDFNTLAKNWAKTKGIEGTTIYSKNESELTYYKSDIYKIYLAYENGKPISALRLGYFNGIISAIQIFSAYLDAASLGGPYLTWTSIKQAKDEGFGIYDFTGGEAPPSDYKKKKLYEKQWSNLLSYKKKWGGKEYPYYHFLKVKSKLSYKIFRVLSKPDSILRSYKKNRFKKPIIKK